MALATRAERAFYWSIRSNLGCIAQIDCFLLRSTLLPFMLFHPPPLLAFHPRANLPFGPLHGPTETASCVTTTAPVFPPRPLPRLFPATRTCRGSYLPRLSVKVAHPEPGGLVHCCWNADGSSPPSRRKHPPAPLPPTPALLACHPRAILLSGPAPSLVVVDLVPDCRCLIQVADTVGKLMPSSQGYKVVPVTPPKPHLKRPC